MKQTELTAWKALDIKEIPCPKCQAVGKLTHNGMDKYRRWHNVFCSNCRKPSTELQVRAMVEAKPKPNVKQKQPVTISNNTTSERLDRLEDLLEKVLQGGVIKPQPAKAKPEPKKTTFNWDDYKGTETEMKIQQLVSILRENPKWGTVKLARQLQKLNMGLRRTIIVKVKNAFREGYFNV